MTTRHAFFAAVSLSMVLAACQPPAPSAEAPGNAATDDAADGTAAQSGFTETAAEAPVVRYQCGELAVGARFTADGDSVELAYSGQRRTLAGDGADYVDDAGNVFRSGAPASLALAGEPTRECVPTEHVSPWEAAAARGVAFRALGQEPGWLVEIGDGEQPNLSAQLDYGERRIELADAAPLDDGSGFHGETGDGTEVRLEIARESCADPMSGERFEAAARLRVGDREYHGCGAYLED
ncbi:hypothetical protein H0E84_13270 [Luteimonas sp. SJ-92]|uniref:C-type lysozyme inhibitor domain-containing protein n=1 Tax=Luteimonas salinisoli TaxID=2752307 RepID=A0A853JDG8_9GAMM|nr:hypothetical protein [Luteimonas salinisoli]NZA27356.1 hypothetical protein [Luteimonas salinisoli]